LLLATTSPRPALDLGRRPDPALGIYETVLVRQGAVADMKLHLDRLRASARELYGIEPSDDLPAQILERAAGHSGRLRVMLAPDGAIGTETGPIGDADYTALAPYLLPGGFGPHKLADRRLMTALMSDADGALPLLVDADGSVLETAFTSVMIEERGRLIAPPDDRRALPGIGRLRFHFTHQPIDLGRLLAADAVILTSALRVIRLPARHGAGEPTALTLAVDQRAGRFDDRGVHHHRH
jgi:para-aminobenzoate synthetase/4-amino-4-deoxychorismate lyase